ncbi:MAG: hypothetical protein AMJ41_02855 [candidate division Zixibacteria bacterium DG_27]|nr:MAG: hypothetical protein AMJ41_02855 [candidate division Zixibacteria bacterium DG_27]
MKEEIKTLVEIVGEEIKEFQDFLGFLTRQTEVLTAGDFDSFERSVALQEEVSVRLDLLEKRRQELTSSLAEKLNLDHPGDGLAKVAQLVEVSQSTKLRELYETLLGLCSKIEQARVTNELLIQESVGLLQSSSSSSRYASSADLERFEGPKPVYEVAGMMN